MSALVVRGASVWRDGRWQTGDLTCVDGYIVDAAAGDAPELDAAGLIAAPGFIDLQCNGAMGVDLARHPERLWELAAHLPRWGVTSWLPTIVTSPPGTVDRALATLAAGPPSGWRGATPLGLHLEGPFLAPTKKGAHDASFLVPPTLAAVDGWSRREGVLLVTLAPELPGALAVITALVERDVVVSLGHSAATAAEARAGVDAGATWVTHLFNAMEPLHHRAPGLVGVALTDPRLRAGVIADGIHVDPIAVSAAHHALGDRLTLVTDAVGALGLAGGEGVDGVRLEDGTLAGSNLSLDQAVRNLVAFTGCEPEIALRAASSGPAAVLGEHSRGRLGIGASADIVLLTSSLEVVATIVGGDVVHPAGERGSL